MNERTLTPTRNSLGEQIADSFLVYVIGWKGGFTDHDSERNIASRFRNRQASKKNRA